MTSTTNSTQAPVNTALLANPFDGEINVVASSKKEEKSDPAKPVAGFAKNTRYSIYHNGGGYTGL